MDILEKKVKELLSRPGSEKQACPSELELAGLLQGTLSPEEEAGAKGHLTQCPQCLEAVRIGLELEEEMAGPVPKRALTKARSVFKPSMGKRMGLLASSLFRTGHAPRVAPSFAVRGTELATRRAWSGYVQELGIFRCEVEVEKVYDDKFQLVVWIYERLSKKTVSGLRVSCYSAKQRFAAKHELRDQSRELESLVLEKGRAIFEPVPAGEYLLKISQKRELLGGLIIRMKGEGK